MKKWLINIIFFVPYCIFFIFVSIITSPNYEFKSPPKRPTPEEKEKLWAETQAWLEEIRKKARKD